MQAPSAFVEQPAGERKQSQNQRVEPDERIEDEVGAQPAQPAIIFFGNGVWTLARDRHLRLLRGSLRFHLCVRFLHFSILGENCQRARPQTCILMVRITSPTR